MDLQCMHLLYHTHTLTHTPTHTSHRKTICHFFSVAASAFPLICPSLGPASQRRAVVVVVVVVGRYSLHSLEIKVNSGNHFQLPSSDYFGRAAWHCEKGLGVSTARKKAPITAPSCLLTAGMYWAGSHRTRAAKGHRGNCSCVSCFSAAPKLFSKSLKNSPKTSSLRKKDGLSSEERGRIETALCEDAVF